MIEAYGRLWNRDFVKWEGKKGNPRSLTGIVKHKGKEITVNCWDQKGIYVLYNGYEVVYVGRGPIGNRLHVHTKDELQDRWNKFSWYGVRKILTTTGVLKELSASDKSIDIEEFIVSLEAIAIYIADPPLNKKYGSLKKHEVIQKKYEEAPKSDRELLETILQRLERT